MFRYRRTVEEEEQRIREINESGDGVYVLVRDDKTRQLIGCGGCFRIKNRQVYDCDNITPVITPNV